MGIKVLLCVSLVLTYDSPKKPSVLHNRRRSGNRRRFQRQYQHLLKAALSILKSLSSFTILPTVLEFHTDHIFRQGIFYIFAPFDDKNTVCIQIIKKNR